MAEVVIAKKDLTTLQISLFYSNILTQTVEESEKPVQKQTMGLAVSTLRGDDDDDVIRSVLIMYSTRNEIIIYVN